MATSNARQSINEADPDRQPHQVELPTGPTHIAARSNRTPQQVESNRVFMAAAGRVKFGRHEATLHAVWIAFALFASLGPERICYAAVERKREDEDEDKPGIAERARVSGRTVRRHIPALIDRGLIKAENRVGGRTPTVWKVILPDELIGPELTACPPRPDTVSDDIKDRTYVQGRAPFRGQARPCEKGVKSGSRPPKSPPGRSVLQEHGSIPNTTAAPLKGSPAPSPSPLIVVATPKTAQPHIEAMREIVQRTTGTTTTTTEDDQPSHFDINPETEARLAEQDRRLHGLEEQHPLPPPKTNRGCAQCGNRRLMGGSCDNCGHDDGTGFQPSADYNNGH